VRHIGLSDTPAWYAARAQTLTEWRGYEPLSTLRLEYSLVERNIERGVCALGVGIGPGHHGLESISERSTQRQIQAESRAFTGEGRLDTLKDSQKLSKRSLEQNWKIVGETRSDRKD